MGERLGASLTIDPIWGWIFPAAAAAGRMGTEESRNNQIRARMISGTKTVDCLGSDGKNLFSRALKAHGPLTSSTMYTFVPAYGLGGTLDVEHIEVADAATYVEMLAAVTPHQTMGDITLS